MNITIITVGKLKEKYLKDGINEYSKRLSRFCRLDIIEINDEKAPDNLSQREALLVKSKEGDAIDKYLKDNTYKIALYIEGKMLSSEEFAKTIEDLRIKGTSSIAFIIGGSLGLSEGIISKCDMKLSFSKMTFPHQLMRLILLEQIYRGFKIISGETYHK
ncbi:ribosomal RNA large subunit methyltransferase H [Oxobacter pfennigii]|uniref:Ribosomal RNA large subunit methyltransferase H n=1 Tax=Oxobacter pfennigii TaxID=36849 RepID=A0A0P8WX27_9CLOT|nr:23S rRNA (pseudouridine(1915)-N(3))-methyltransferase RlmH [Oxobacter pfennigii]KPU42847.1 ribosomal RNA large subunit methyltransferase H [Oxobacter pfennigii]